jgi:hypothetical protein
VQLLVGINVVLVVSYVGLIAIVMSYAALHVEFAQQVRSDEAVVAALEAEYLNTLSHITTTDYLAAGYEKPDVKVFVTGAGPTALR